MKIKTGCKKILLSQIVMLSGGKLVGEDIPVEYICTDSREADDMTLFVALRGERVDGHDFIGSAVSAGGRAFLVEREDVVPNGMSAVLVGNCEDALMRIAHGYRSMLDCRIVGITGSVGKTTTKEFVWSVLSQKFQSYKTEGNFNSLIGMPLSLVATPTDTEAAVYEMGMSQLNEISRMSRAAEPDVAVITNIGSSHMEALGSRENIRRAKLEILEGLKPGGRAVINGDDDMLFGLDCLGTNTVYVGIKNLDADYCAHNIRIFESETIFDVSTPNKLLKDIKIPVSGEHNVYAALIATAIGDIMNIGEAGIRAGLEAYQNVGLRQKTVPVAGFTVIADCYNASPESMRAALRAMTARKKENRRLIALLGDMRELGKDSDELHREVGRFVCECGIDLLFTLGKSAEHIAAGAIDAGMPEENVFVSSDENDYETTAKELACILRSGDVLLVKASRAIRAERVVEVIKTLYGA